MTSVSSGNSDCASKEFMLEESLDITVINEFYIKLKSLLSENNSPIAIDAKNLKRIDTSALQLMCAWIRETQNNNIPVIWKNADGILLHSARLLGLSEHLSLE
ncbi:STAS domain-containing protein [Kaarinaea lacus]